MAPYIIMLAAGIGIPLMAALNAAMSAHMSSTATATAVMLTIACATAMSIAMVQGFQGAIHLKTAPKHLLLAGVLFIFYITSITWAAPRIGIGNAVFLVLLGQLISTTLIGHFGWLGAMPAPISMQRLAGLCAMSLGVYLTVKA